MNNKKDTKLTTQKFHPPIRPRYLPGEVSDGARMADYRSYKNHRLACARAKPKVDNAAPKLDLESYYKQELMREDARQAKFRCRENFCVVKSINAVFRTGGKVDCWNLKDREYKTEQDLLKTEYKRIELENVALHKKLNSLTSEFSPEVMAKQWRVLKRDIIEKSRFPWFSRVPRYPSITNNANGVGVGNRETERPRCFFDLELGSSNLPLGRIVFELYADYVPSVCANFEAFCRGFNGLSYKGTPFHRILSGYYCQGGDVTKFNGIGGASIFDDDDAATVETAKLDENDLSRLRHSCPGVLSTSRLDDNTFDSKFYLTFRPLITMDGKNVVFGKIVKGLPNLLKVNAYGTKFGKPLQKVIVANCGALPSKSSSRRSSGRSRISNRSK